MRKRLSGPEALPYIGVARTQLGILKNAMSFQGLNHGTRTFTHADGTIIFVQSVFGQDTINVQRNVAAPALGVVMEAKKAAEYEEIWTDYVLLSLPAPYVRAEMRLGISPVVYGANLRDYTRTHKFYEQYLLGQHTYNQLHEIGTLVETYAEGSAWVWSTDGTSQYLPIFHTNVPVNQYTIQNLPSYSTPLSVTVVNQSGDGVQRQVQVAAPAASKAVLAWNASGSAYLPQYAPELTTNALKMSDDCVATLSAGTLRGQATALTPEYPAPPTYPGLGMWGEWVGVILAGLLDGDTNTPGYFRGMYAEYGNYPPVGGKKVGSTHPKYYSGDHDRHAESLNLPLDRASDYDSYGVTEIGITLIGAVTSASGSAVSTEGRVGVFHGHTNDLYNIQSVENDVTSLELYGTAVYSFDWWKREFTFSRWEPLRTGGLRKLVTPPAGATKRELLYSNALVSYRGVYWEDVKAALHARNADMTSGAYTYTSPVLHELIKALEFPLDPIKVPKP